MKTFFLNAIGLVTLLFACVSCHDHNKDNYMNDAYQANYDNHSTVLKSDNKSDSTDQKINAIPYSYSDTTRSNHNSTRAPQPKKHRGFIHF
jgi:hypothetical protein